MRRRIMSGGAEISQRPVRIVPPSGTVLDPFTGSGTTGAAALLEGRQFIGIEQSPQHAETAQLRLAQTEGA
jgi:site-specific DNA-methyltransferase (adenine-specific)